MNKYKVWLKDDDTDVKEVEAYNALDAAEIVAEARHPYDDYFKEIELVVEGPDGIMNVRVIVEPSNLFIGSKME